MTQIKATTDFIYMYGVILAEELQSLDVPAIMGIDQKTVTLKIYKNLAAVITPVNAHNFSQEQIDLQLKDAEWLREKAFHHHEIISIIHQNTTVLPMSFCTIFQNESNLESLLADQYDVIYQKLLTLMDKQEWNLKVFCNNETALSFVLQHNEEVVDLRAQLASMPKGKQFLMKKKLEHLIHSQLEVEQSKWWSEFQQQLTSVVSEINLRQNWGKEVTERKDEMIVNCDLLIDQGISESFMNKITVIEKSFEPLGCTFQVTGPWPPYHFSRTTKEIL